MHLPFSENFFRILSTIDEMFQHCMAHYFSILLQNFIILWLTFKNTAL